MVSVPNLSLAKRGKFHQIGSLDDSLSGAKGSQTTEKRHAMNVKSRRLMSSEEGKTGFVILFDSFRNAYSHLIYFYMLLWRKNIEIWWHLLGVPKLQQCQGMSHLFKGVDLGLRAQYGYKGTRNLETKTLLNPPLTSPPASTHVPSHAPTVPTPSSHTPFNPTHLNPHLISTTFISTFHRLRSSKYSLCLPSAPLNPRPLPSLPFHLHVIHVWSSQILFNLKCMQTFPSNRIPIENHARYVSAHSKIKTEHKTRI